MDDVAILDGFPISEFDQYSRSKGWQPETLRRYREYLFKLKDYLGEEEATKTSLTHWKNMLLTKYRLGCVQVHLAAANNYFLWAGRPDLIQCMDLAKNSDSTEDCERETAPSLTRFEYMKLLRTARAKNKRRAYLLISLFVSTGILQQCLDQITVELINEGDGTITLHGKPQAFHCPEILQKSLLEYSRQQNISKGPIFVTQSGKPISRTLIFREIREICKAANIPVEKGNFTSLRKLFLQSQESINTQLVNIQYQLYDQMLELEEDIVGWSFS